MVTPFLLRLLLCCYRYWDFPKGELEPGEDPLYAARREVTEEAGLQGLDFRWGKGYAGGKVARYYPGRMQWRGSRARHQSGARPP